jgi:hypothetical protein
MRRHYAAPLSITAMPAFLNWLKIIIKAANPGAI